MVHIDIDLNTLDEEGLEAYLLLKKRAKREASPKAKGPEDVIGPNDSSVFGDKVIPPIDIAKQEEGYKNILREYAKNNPWVFVEDKIPIAKIVKDAGIPQGSLSMGQIKDVLLFEYPGLTTNGNLDDWCLVPKPKFPPQRKIHANTDSILPDLSSLEGIKFNTKTKRLRAFLKTNGPWLFAKERTFLFLFKFYVFHYGVSLLIFQYCLMDFLYDVSPKVLDSDKCCPQGNHGNKMNFYYSEHISGYRY